MTFGSLLWFIKHWKPLSIVIEFKSPITTWRLGKMRDSIMRKKAKENNDEQN